MTELHEALRLTGAFKSSGGQQVPLKWAKPEGSNLFAELKAACDHIEKYRTPVIIVPDEEIKAQAQAVIDERGLDAVVITRQEYWEQGAARHHCGLHPSLPFELAHVGVLTPRNRKERRHGRDY